MKTQNYSEMPGEGVNTETETLPSIMSVKELAKYLQVSIGLIYRLHAETIIPGGQRIGRIIRFDTKSVLDWIRMGERIHWRPKKKGSARKGGR